MPGLRKLVSGLSLQRPGFSHKGAHVGFVVDVVTLGQSSSLSTSVFLSGTF
jgi:hypothetical protein